MAGFGVSSKKHTFASSGAAVTLSSITVIKQAQNVFLRSTTGNATPVYVGGSDVTSSNGLALVAGVILNLTELMSGPDRELFDLTQVYVAAADGITLEVLFDVAVNNPRAQ